MTLRIHKKTYEGMKNSIGKEKKLWLSFDSFIVHFLHCLLEMSRRLAAVQESHTGPTTYGQCADFGRIRT